MNLANSFGGMFLSFAIHVTIVLVAQRFSFSITGMKIMLLFLKTEHWPDSVEVLVMYHLPSPLSPFLKVTTSISKVWSVSMSCLEFSTASNLKKRGKYFKYFCSKRLCSFKLLWLNIYIFFIFFDSVN